MDALGGLVPVVCPCPEGLVVSGEAGFAMPGSADVSHHPFQGEIDELVTCILEDRETHLNVFDAQRTMEICIASDRSAARGGRPVSLPIIRR